MRKLLLSFCLIILSGILFSQQEKYSRVRILTNDFGLRKLAQAGIAVDHGNYRKGVFFESDFSETEIQKIKSLGLNYEIKIEDVSQFYQMQNDQQQKKDITGLPLPTAPSQSCGGQLPTAFYPTPSNFSLGTMGGYYKYNEFLAQIDSMASKYPNLISARMPIDTFHSIEGREIYWLKISDNPTIDESEPEVIYTALHHAREPGSLSQLIFYMWYLLENYGTNPEVTSLVDNTEMYFVPMVNPDGYIYNQTTNPNGGGMWRKNRRSNGGGQYGVDINRNYGYKWGIDDSGSSPDPSSTSETYRGQSAFSEPETQAAKFFCEQHNFRIALNYHTYGNLFIYPWGYDYSIYTPDSALFVNYAQWMTRDNHYNFGTGDQTVGYITNGDSDDWMYGEQTSKNKIFSCTPEVGADDLGFWPPSNSIIDLCQSNMTQNLSMAQLVGKYAKVKETSSQFISIINGYFPFRIQRLGLDSPATFTVSISPVGNSFTSIGTGKTFSSMNLLEEKTDSISYSLDPAISMGTEFKFIISVDNGLFVSSDTITKIYGQPTVALSDTCNNLNYWTSGWGISNTIYHSPTSSITDSPSGLYPNSDANSVELNQSINLTTAIDAMLTFWAKWEIEPGWDYAQVLASSDNGSTWTPLCGKYTKPGNSNQDNGQPLYDGMQLSWVMEEISLKDFAGSNVLLKFEITSDNYLNYDGFYFDDLKIEIIAAPPNPGINSLSIIPSAPTENDTVKLVATSTFPSGGCNQSDFLMQLSNDTFRLNSTHNVGPLTVICTTVDTAALGKLAQGTYTLIYFLTDSATSLGLDTDTIVFTVLPAVGINDNEEKFYLPPYGGGQGLGFVIYPNPASDVVNIYYSIPENGLLIIYNYLGEIVLSQQVSGNQHQLLLNISKITSGVYFYMIVTENYHSEVKRMAVMK